MSKHDAALLWAREEFAQRSFATARKAIREGNEDAHWQVEIRAEAFRAGQAHTDGLVTAFTRQADNMAFILNHFDVPAQWYDKFTQELAHDRAAITAAKGAA